MKLTAVKILMVLMTVSCGSINEKSDENRDSSLRNIIPFVSDTNWVKPSGVFLSYLSIDEVDENSSVGIGFSVDELYQAPVVNFTRIPPIYSIAYWTQQTDMMVYDHACIEVISKGSDGNISELTIKIKLPSPVSKELKDERLKYAIAKIKVDDKENFKGSAVLLLSGKDTNEIKITQSKINTFPAFLGSYELFNSRTKCND